MGPSPPLPKLDVGTPGPAKVSVVVPCYNMGRWLPQTLCNIQQFSWSDLEVIVVDDGSTDPGTVQLIEELEASPTAGLRVVRLEFNQGLSAARNAGVAAAQGEFTLC
ncbi:glycosyltransferase family 2 protein, partial [Klebsiella pneumoniae]